MSTDYSASAAVRGHCEDPTWIGHGICLPVLGVGILDLQTNNRDEVCRGKVQEYMAFKQRFEGKIGLLGQKREGIQRSHAERTLWGKLYNHETAWHMQKTRNSSVLLKFQVGRRGGGASPLGLPQRTLTPNELSLTPGVREDGFGWEVISSEFGLIYFFCFNIVILWDEMDALGERNLWNYSPRNSSRTRVSQLWTLCRPCEDEMNSWYHSTLNTA